MCNWAGMNTRSANQYFLIIHGEWEALKSMARCSELGLSHDRGLEIRRIQNLLLITHKQEDFQAFTSDHSLMVLCHRQIFYSKIYRHSISFFPPIQYLINMYLLSFCETVSNIHSHGILLECIDNTLNGVHKKDLKKLYSYSFLYAETELNEYISISSVYNARGKNIK